MFSGIGKGCIGNEWVESKAIEILNDFFVYSKYEFHSKR